MVNFLKVVEKDAETERKRAIIVAEKEAQVAKIQYSQKIMEKESLQRMAQIEDEMHLAREKSRSDAEFYQSKRQAEANSILLTPQYIELKKYEALTQNNKIFYGNKIPNMFTYGGCASENELSDATDNKVIDDKSTANN